MPTSLEQGVEGRFAILIDGAAEYGFIRSVSGGTIRGQIDKNAFQIQDRPAKRLVSSSYDNLKMVIGMGAPDRLLEWVQASVKKSGPVSRSGEVHTCATDLTSLNSRDFFDAQMVDIGFPSLDAKSKEPAFLSLEILPAGVRYRSGTGKKIPAPSVPKSNQWMSSNFRVTLGDLPCERVIKVESWTWHKEMKRVTEGKMKHSPTNAPAGSVTISDLRLTINAVDIAPWLDFANTFIVQGDSEPDNEIQGSIELLSGDLHNSLARIDLIDCGIMSLAMADLEANQESIAAFQVEMYVGALDFQFKRQPD